jgi:hypothetical protein
MAFSVARPRAISPSLYGKARFGPGKSPGGNWSGGGPYPDYPPPPDYPDVNQGADNGNQGPELVGQRQTGVVQDRISRPSLFGNVGTMLGDVATGAANIRSTDPFTAFAQGFSGERAARAQRDNLAYDRSVAADDRAYSRSLDSQKMDLDRRRVDAYEQATGAKAKPLIDDKGHITAEGQKFLIQEDIAYEKQLISSMGAAGTFDVTKPDVMDTIHKMVAAHHEEYAQKLSSGEKPELLPGAPGNPLDMTGIGGGGAASSDAAPPSAGGPGILDKLAPEGGVSGLLGRMGTKAAGDLQGVGNSVLDAIDSGVSGLAAGMPTMSGGAPSPAPPVVAPITPPPPIMSPARGVAAPTPVTPAAPHGAVDTDAAYAAARKLLAQGVSRDKVDAVLTSYGVDPSGL